LPESGSQGCDEREYGKMQLRRNPLVARLVNLSGIASHGFWIPAIPAGMTSYANTYAFRKNAGIRNFK